MTMEHRHDAVRAAASPPQSIPGGGIGRGAEPPSEEKHVVVGTAGHIDHGKTALVKALTGIDTDRSEEHTSELQSLAYLVCRLLLEKKKRIKVQDVCCDV